MDSLEYPIAAYDHPKRVLGLTIAVLIVFALPIFHMSALADDLLDREFEFASGLVDLGFPDFAEKVVEQVLMKHPDQKDRAKLIRAQIFISRRKFDEAQALLKEMPADNPKAQAISLALANAHYRLGDFDKAKKGYEGFFKSYKGRVPTDPDLRRFYQESAYQLGQMLEKAEDYEGAVNAYERVIATSPDKSTHRRLLANTARLYVELGKYAGGDRRGKYLNKAKKACDEIQWGGLDVWFGQSIITLANMELAQGDKPGAQKVLKDHMDILKEIDGFLKEQGMPMSESPMAGARFLLGELYEEQGQSLLKKKGKKSEAIKFLGSALGEFYNVFAKYGDSDWGSEAGVRATRVKEQLEGLGKTVKIDLGQHAAKAAATQFRLADNLFREKQYKQAVDEYLKVLNPFPENESAPAALANLTLSYANQGDELYVKMMLGYLGERFSKSDQAAMAMLAVGKYYFDQKNTNVYTYAYEAYLQHFPEHERAAAILYTLAGLRKQAGDNEGAGEYYQRIIDNYPKDLYYVKALSRLAWDRYLGKDYEKAVPGLIAYVNASQPGFEKAQAQFVLGDCYKQIRDFNKALLVYKELIGWLAPADSPYNTSSEAEKKNKNLLEKSAFYRGYCYARISEPAESVPQFRAAGMKAYRQFLSLFPESELASKAMNGLGAIHLELGQFDAAAKAFEDLASTYPESEEGKSALFSLLRSAMEVKKYDIAKDALSKMLDNPGEYSPEQFSAVGQMMLDAGLNQESIKAFKQVRLASDERALLERSLYGLGRAAYALKQYDGAAKYMEELMTRYPKSGLFYDAKFILGNSYREVKRLDDAVLALSDVFRYADDQVLINRANCIFGKIKEEQGDVEAALASYQRVALLANPDNPELRPMIEECILLSIEKGMALQRYTDVQDSCDQYLKLFPESDKIEEVRKIKANAKLEATKLEAAAAAKKASESQ